METLPAQFSDALSRIDIGGKSVRAKEAHSEVTGHLEASDLLRSWGVSTILIGSYARHTAIYPGKDVDVFVRLTSLDTTSSASDVFDEVQRVLLAEYGDRVEVHDRSMNVQFEADGFGVDVVPAVISDQRWAIPNKDRNMWGSGEPHWEVTDPERLTELTTRRNQAPEIDDHGAYVRTVKLVRQTRRHHLGQRTKPGGLFLELSTYQAFEDGVPEGSYAEIFAASLRSIADQLTRNASDPLRDPALDAPYSPMPEDAAMLAAAAQFSELADTADAALNADPCQAAVMWRKILGTNDRGQCFPLPPGCDERGNRVDSVRVNTGRGSDEARPFG